MGSSRWWSAPILGFAAQNKPRAMKRQTPAVIGNDDPAPEGETPWCEVSMSGYVGGTMEESVIDQLFNKWTFECYHDHTSGDVVLKVTRPENPTGPMMVYAALLNGALSTSGNLYVSASLDEEDPTFVKITHMSMLMEPNNPFVDSRHGTIEVKVAVYEGTLEDMPSKRVKIGSPTSVGYKNPMESELSLLNDPLEPDHLSDKPSLIDLTMNINYDSKQATGMVGLKNQGATCYVNSLLQTLFYLRPFRKAVYDTPTADDDTEKAVSTKELTKAFGWSHMDAFTQHDVQELYRILCDRLEEKMKKTTVDGVIQQLFEGKVNSFISCVNVDCTSSREESFYDLQLDVKGCENLDESFAKYVEVEMLDGDNQYDAKGFGKQDAKKGLSFVSFPPILNIQLKRFEYDPLRDGMVKVHDRFEFPKELNLEKYVHSNGASARYHLHSILVHSGDVHGGHYYVYIRPQESFQSPDSQWFKFDDDIITSVEEEAVMESGFGSKVAASSFSSAYMLVYVQTGSWTECDVPMSLLERFQAEEIAVRRRKRLAQREHLFLQVRLATDDSVARLKRITRTTDFAFFPKGTKPAPQLVKMKVLKTNTIREFYGQVHLETGVPINNMRLWKMATRENQTTRPDEPLDNYPLETSCAQILEEDPHSKSVALFLEILQDGRADHIGTIKKFTLQDFDPVMTSPMPSPEELDDESPPQLHPLAAEAATFREALPPPTDTMLLFIKQYDPTMPAMGDRLSYVGNMLVLGASLVSEVIARIHSHVDLGDKAIDLYEEVQPESINLLEPSHSLLESELQHGDMLIYQTTPTSSDEEAYATVPLYFDYLLNRTEVTFRPLQSPKDDEKSTTLPCLLTYTYDTVLATLANHLHVDPLHLRLYQHSSIHEGPKPAPLRHSRYSGDKYTTLRSLVVEYGESSRPSPNATIYYEILPVSIIEMELKIKWVLHLSPYEPAFGGTEKMEVLLDPTNTVADVLSIVQKKWNCPHPLKLVLTRDRSTILSFASPLAAVSTVPSSTSAPLLVESIPPEKSKTSASLGVLGCMQFFTNGDEWITTHSTPCCIELFVDDTFASIRARLQRRMGVADEVFSKWRLAAIFENKSIALEKEPGDMNIERVVDWLEKQQLRMDMSFLGLEHTPPVVKSDHRLRRHEQGIKIRSSS
ncbi:unnamed protein product [Aphanomyces euteiches]